LPRCSFPARRLTMLTRFIQLRHWRKSRSYLLTLRSRHSTDLLHSVAPQTYMTTQLKKRHLVAQAKAKAKADQDKED
jgi:hypothetical protein